MRHETSRRRRAVTALAIVIALLACGDDGTGPVRPALAGVTVANAVDTLGIADTLRLQAEVRDMGDAVAAVPVAWRSLESTVATVSESGLLTGVDSGDARIVVTATGRWTVADTLLVHVRPLPHAFELSGLGDTVYVSGFASVTVRPTVMDGRGLVMPTPRLEWSSSDTSVLAVDSLGRVTGRGLGGAWLRVAAGPARDSVRVPVDYRQVSTPVPFVQYSQATIAIGSCGRTAAGGLWCGNSAVVSPVAFTDVQVGQSSNCGLAADSTAWCWGTNTHAQFGNGVRSSLAISTPIQGFGGRKLRRLAVGDHLQNCGIQAADSVLVCAGHNDFGQVGRMPATSDEIVLAPVTGLLKALDVDITGFHGCAVALDGALWCWGERWLAEAPAVSAVAPMRATAPGPWVQVAVVDFAACLRAGDGTVECRTIHGMRPLATTARFATIAATSRYDVCGLTAAGEMWCWDPGREDTTAPIPARHVAPGRTYASLATSGGTACMIDMQQRLYCF